MPDSYNNILNRCAASLLDLQRQAAQSCAPVGNDLIRTKSQDAHAIEHTLDRHAAAEAAERGVERGFDKINHRFIRNARSSSRPDDRSSRCYH